MALCPSPSTFPCGRCLICRINQSRVWSARLMLETQCHEYSSFQTFTYKTEPSSGLVKAHISDTFHRLRDLARQRGKRVRFYAVGEYGSRTSRPHYHAAVYGLLPEDQGLLEQAWSSTPGSGNLDPNPSALEPQSAAYIVGYITGKHAHEHFIHGGLEPPFSVMSRRPGIGMPWLPNLIGALESPDGALYLRCHSDIPPAVSIGSRSIPLGSYMRQQLRLYFFGDHRVPREGSLKRGAKTHAEILSLLPPLPVNSSAAEELDAWIQAQTTYKERRANHKKVRARQIETRKKIFDQMRTL